jgi:ABC-type Fe3+ transport system substrate-binding protein
VKAKQGQAFIDWLLSDEGQAAIAGFKIEGQQLFFPNAKRAVDRAAGLTQRSGWAAQPLLGSATP